MAGDRGDIPVPRFPEEPEESLLRQEAVRGEQGDEPLSDHAVPSRSHLSIPVPVVACVTTILLGNWLLQDVELPITLVVIALALSLVAGVFFWMKGHSR